MWGWGGVEAPRGVRESEGFLEEVASERRQEEGRGERCSLLGWPGRSGAGASRPKEGAGGRASPGLSLGPEGRGQRGRRVAVDTSGSGAGRGDSRRLRVRRRSTVWRRPWECAGGAGRRMERKTGEEVNGAAPWMQSRLVKPQGEDAALGV